MSLHNPTEDAFGSPSFGSFFLEENPTAAFFARLQQPGFDPRQRRFFEGQGLSPTFNQFQGQLGGLLQADPNTIPTLTFQDFLRDFDFNQRFFQQPIGQRRTSGLAGNARFQF